MQTAEISWETMALSIRGPSLAGCYQADLTGDGVEGELDARGSHAKEAMVRALQRLRLLVLGPYQEGKWFGRTWGQVGPFSWTSRQDQYMVTEFPLREPRFAATLLLRVSGGPLFPGAPRATLAFHGRGADIEAAHQDLIEAIRRAQRALAGKPPGYLGESSSPLGRVGV